MSILLEQHKKHLEQLAELITQEEQCALIIAPEKSALLDELAEQKQKTGDRFMVLVVGEFNSGKTSMINAMMGREILPTGDLPETGVITEIVYGEELKVTLYPKPDSGIPEPVVLAQPSISEIRKYCSIDNKGLLEEQTTENILYERTVVECDLPMLREGIILVDSVGLNDPWGNDYITERYFPKADAIIYLMSATSPYSKEDKELLEEINDSGLRNLIIAYTKFGIVQHNYRRKPASELQTYMDVVMRHALPHTDLGGKAVHFIDSIDALDAKQAGDQDLLIRSGMDGLEKFCNRYLVEEKGRYKIIALVGAIESKERELLALAQLVKESAGRSKEELAQKVAAAKTQLETASATADATIAKFEERVAKTMPIYEESIRNHIQTLADGVNLEGYTIQAKLPRNFAKLIPGLQQKRSRAIAEECKAELERRMRLANTEWIKTELTKKIQETVETSVDEMSGDIAAFYEQLDSIDATLSSQKKKEDKQRNLANILTGIAYGVITGDLVIGGIGATHGSDAITRAVASDLVLKTIMNLAVKAGAKITVSAYTWVLILGNIVAVLLENQDAAEQRIVAETIALLKKEYTQDTEGLERSAQAIIDGYRLQMNQCVANYKQMMKKELQPKVDKINAAIEVLNKDAKEQADIIRRNDEAIVSLQKIVEGARQIAENYRL